MRFYCSTAGQAPADPIDWRARAEAVEAIPADGVAEDGTEITTTRDAARTAEHEYRLGIASHVVRNGNGPRVLVGDRSVAAELPADPRDLLFGEDVDEHGGRLVYLSAELPSALRCPECLEPLRVVTE